MTCPGDRKREPAAGFTLIEMLVVISILGVVGAIALPLLSRPLDGLRLAAAARDMIAALRVTRSAAITRNTELALVLDADKRSFASPVFPERLFPAEINATLNVAEPERITASRGGFRFFADGSSTGGEVVLSLKARQIRICVHWLTGQPVEAANC